MDLFTRLNFLAREALAENRRVVICPFYQNGMLLKQILNTAYGIEEYMILDNGLSMYNPQIKPITSLKDASSDNLVVLLNSTNKKTNAELVRELKAVNDKIIIKNILNPVYIEEKEKENYFREIKELLKVKRCVDKDLIRIGNISDGGYVMVDDFQKSMRSYSFGIGAEISYDLHMASLVSHNYMYDFSIDRVPYNHYNFEFYKEGIAGEDKPDKRLYSMETILKRNGDLYNKNLILKMDVEGAEWEFIQKCPEDVLDNFVQMTFELHEITNLSHRQTVISALLKLIKTHQPVWIHGNVAEVAEYANEAVIPSLLEVTFANRKRYEFVEGAFISPLEIDYPNVGSVDFDLGNWGS